jgi:uncharacterized protein YdeI (YjbR/CyaY-like superfamily)
MAKAKTFNARLERLRGNLGWIIATVPFSVEKTWGTGSRLKVKIEVNGEPYRTSLFPTRTGKHFILVNKKMQKAAGVRLGDSAKFRVEPDTDERVVKAPAELAAILNKQARMRKWYEQMTYSYRQAIAKWITEPKSPAARKKRAEEIAERILLTMEAEIEIPPHIKQIFDRIPNAHRGWQLLTPIKRRGHLFGIFGYKSIGSRTRRTEKAAAEAVQAAERAAR